LKKKLFIISPFHYNYFINNINAVWVSKNLFRNGNIYFYFLSYNNFKIEIKHNIFNALELNKKPMPYQIQPNNTNPALDYIKYNKKNFDFYFIYPENVFAYSFQMYSFIEYFNLNDYYLKNNTDIDYLDKFTFLLDTFNKQNRFENIIKIKKTILKKVYITMLSNVIFSFFYSKTTTQENVDLLFLMIDNIIKNNINKESKNIISFLQDESIDNYINLYKSIGNNLKYLYMYIDFESDTFNILNKNSYLDLPYQYEINDNIYYSDTETNSNNLTLQKRFFNFNEIFYYLNEWFSIEEIYYKMLHIYEYININNNKEVVDYFSPINIHINDNLNQIISELDNNLENEDYYTLHFLYNNFFNLLKSSYKENSRELIKCPFCIDGKIYNGKNKFFCNECDFFLIKSYIKDKYNFELTKRYMKILINNKYITINYNGENRILFLRETNKGIFLTLLRKR